MSAFLVNPSRSPTVTEATGLGDRHSDENVYISNRQGSTHAAHHLSETTACARACMRACLCECVHTPVHSYVRVCMCVNQRTSPVVFLRNCQLFFFF